MYLEWLQAQQVRNLNNIYLQPAKQLNVFTGKNASGKTAVLESIFLLARAKSFRTPRIQEVIQHKKKSLIITAKLQHEKEGEITTGIEKQYGKVTIKQNGERIKTVSDQVRKFPIILVTQDTQTLITGTPKNRRHWLDWAMFHVEHDYLENWKRYMRALRHRNSLLKKKEKNRKIYRGWEQAMVESANHLTAQRAAFLSGILQRIKGISGNEIINKIDIKLTRGWPEKKDYLSVLEESWKSDMETGYTRTGIHQAEITITASMKKVSTVYSRGQIKLLTVFLLLAQAMEIQSRTGVKPMIIMDDFKAELDKEGSNHILTWINDHNFQAFLSTTTMDSEEAAKYEYRQFHVEHGEIANISRV